MSQDPARWSSSMGELSPDYEGALTAFRTEGPSEAQLTRMLEGLEGAAPALFAGGSGWKLGLACVVAGAALFGAIWLWPSATPRAPERPKAHASAAAAAPSTEAAAAPSVALVEHPPSERGDDPTMAVAPLPRRSSKPGRRKASAVSAAPSSVAPAAVQDPLAELALLQRARRVLAQQPARALELAEEHARHYPDGNFREERELLAIESLAALSLHAEAQRRGQAFRRQFKQSIHLKRVAELIEH